MTDIPFAPFNWQHAKLESVEEFLMTEKEAGRYRPAFPFP